MSREVALDLDGLIEQCLTVRQGPAGMFLQFQEEQLKALCRVSQKAFLEQPTLLELEAPVKLGGDIHGQFHDLLRMLEVGGLPPESNYLFLGDYVDRGRHGLETITLLLAYKVKYPENFFMLRGNHETASVSRIYGFFDECKRRYCTKIWRTFVDVFNSMPIAACIDDKVLCMHGGLSPELTSLDEIRCVARPMDIPEEGLVCDLLWADPDPEVQGWGPNDRGISYTFGPDVVTQFLKDFDMDLIVRAHQVVEDGYEFFADRSLVTLFGAPAYMGEFDNCAALMAVNEELRCSFQLVSPCKSMR